MCVACRVSSGNLYDKMPSGPWALTKYGFLYWIAHSYRARYTKRTQTLTDFRQSFDLYFARSHGRFTFALFVVVVVAPRGGVSVSWSSCPLFILTILHTATTHMAHKYTFPYISVLVAALVFACSPAPPHRELASRQPAAGSKMYAII